MADPALNLADVAVLAPLGYTLTYRVPERLGPVVPGSRVLVELQRRRVLAMVVERHTRELFDPKKLKDIVQVVDDKPILPDELLAFAREVASYYFAPLGEVLQLILPAVHRDDAKRVAPDGEDLNTRIVGGRSVVHASATDKIDDPSHKLRGAAPSLLAYLRANGSTPVSRLSETWKSAREVTKRLAALGLVTLEQREIPRDPFFRAPVLSDAAPDLTAAQAVAMESIREALADERTDASISRAFLLHGVTGSGKTEVYLRAIERAKELGKGSLMLVPEIALTPQLVDRFRARFGDGVAVLHSALHARDRHAMWLALRRGEVDVAIGARSALFAPVPNLGLIIVDEEHDGSFKQEEGVRYHARDMAILRAHRAGAVCILGSATPSLETEHLARTGRITRLTLPGRARAAARLPEVQTVDLRRTDPGPAGDKRISMPLHRAIVQALERKEQVILFLNRRGFAPSVMCNSCGTIAACPHCSVSLTYHRRTGELRCHYCDHHLRFEGRCPTCQSPDTSLEGVGTERLEDVIEKVFPQARVGRLDRDVAAGARSETVLEQLRKGEIDILVGTQMVAKGHDLPNVTVVGVINADASLSMPDFRAAERAFHLLVQVAGRAGRGEQKGRVFFQTRDPQHPALVLAATHDVHGFIERELNSRAELGYPPFARLALVRIDGPDEDATRVVAHELADVALSTQAAKREAVTVLGPAAAPITRLRGRFRFRILLKARERSALRSVLAALALQLRKLPKDIRAVLDVDPVSML